MGTVVCKKKCHKSKMDAIVDHQVSRGSNNKPFYWYQCPHCYPNWHISTTGVSDQVLSDIVKMIRNQDHEHCEIVEKLSKRKSIRRVQHPIGTFLVLYCTRRREAVILEEVLPI